MACALLLLAQAPCAHAAVEVFGAFSNSGTASGSIASIPAVPPGDYVVLARLDLDNGAGADRTVICTLSAGSGFDGNTVRVQPGARADPDATRVSHQLLVRLGPNPSGNAIHLDCLDDAFGQVKVKFARITAIRLDAGLPESLQREP